MSEGAHGEEVITSFRGEWAPLSNFSYYPAYLDGVQFPTAEHAFQAAKAVEPKDRWTILYSLTPRDAKRIGRSIDLRPDWDLGYKHLAMMMILQSKFEQPWPRATLDRTGNAELIEGNYWHDNEWGSCSCSRPECSGRGKNLLGRYLMQIRSRPDPGPGGIPTSWG